MWDQRYQSDTYAYGVNPNAYMAAHLGYFKPGSSVLVPADGEGRNGVYLAKQGYLVTTFDGSIEGCRKARQLADREGVSMASHHADFDAFVLSTYDGIVLSFFHTPASVRQAYHRACMAALNPGGIVLVHGFGSQQMTYTSGGPRDPEMLFTLPQLRDDFDGLTVLQEDDYVGSLDEGPYHQGPAHLIGFIGRRS
jgi:hypothetical protein